MSIESKILECHYDDTEVILWERGGLCLFVHEFGFCELSLSYKGVFDYPEEKVSFAMRKKLMQQLKYWVDWFDKNLPDTLWVNLYEGDNQLIKRQRWMTKLGFTQLERMPGMGGKNPWRKYSPE
jgi:hypothetical protein